LFLKILIAGGGTGGHIYPALSIADALQRRDQGAEFLFVGTERGLEADLVPRNGFSLRTLKISGFQRRMSWRNVENIGNTFRSLWDSHRILKMFRPDAVIGTGGYVCGPVLLAAAMSGIPTLIQEQNSFPGVTNRILARFVNVVALGYDDAKPRFGHVKARFISSGNPVRSGFLAVERAEAQKTFGFVDGKLTLLIAGGSQGARSINTAALHIHRWFANSNSIQIIHITGSTEYEAVIDLLRREGLPTDEPGKGRLVAPYLHNMAQAMALADIAVSRAGAIALAEIALCGIPSILVPYPHAAENHQEFNARSFVDKGAARLILDRELDGDHLCMIVRELVENTEARQKMQAASRNLAKPDAAERIASEVIALASTRE
jgi:UDP-N-acetylglucosamine--N-acetylmuramyl-(pentapeptide) pyrophosphoryl-undecaprenol N-acetylglucosamine transferase